MSSKSESDPMFVGETRFLDIEIYNDAGVLADPDAQSFRKSGIGISGIVEDTSPTVNGGTGLFRVAITAAAGPGTIQWNWKGSGIGLQPFAVEGFIKVLKPNIAP